MGWFWNASASDPSAASAYSKLDPQLRDYLDRETHLKHGDPAPTAAVPRGESLAADGAPSKYRSQVGLNVAGSTPENHESTPHDGAAAPPESLFPDGRYAHLWSNYRPQAEVDSTLKSDQDRLADVMQTYQNRKTAISNAAIENCVLEQLAERDCLVNGGWRKRMNLCREENRAFTRCYTMQSRFMKALGYLSSLHASAEEEEKIQMHADKLYHEMLEREKTIEAARSTGAEAPQFKALIRPDQTTEVLGEDSAWARGRRKAVEHGMGSNLADYPAEKQQEILERVKDLDPAAREVELQLIVAERRAQLEYSEILRDRLEDEKAKRNDRRARGKETVGDTMKRFWGWDS